MTEQLLTEVKQKSISYSELATYQTCGWKHKIIYKDKTAPKVKSQYMTFGTCLHAAIEYKYSGNNEKTPEQVFEEGLIKEISALEPEVFLKKGEKECTPEVLEIRREQCLKEMLVQGKKLLRQYFVDMTKQFGNYTVVSVEEKIELPLESIKWPGYNFKGYIDMVIKLEDGTYCIIDTKTTSWGWDAAKKTDKITTYQLTYYKSFFAEKHNIPIKNIKTYFCLLKRTANEAKCIEIFEVPCGQVKITNSKELLSETIRLIDKNISLKNRNACKDNKTGFDCPFYKTKWCQ